MRTKSHGYMKWRRKRSALDHVQAAQRHVQAAQQRTRDFPDAADQRTADELRAVAQRLGELNGALGDVP